MTLIDVQKRRIVSKFAFMFVCSYDRIIMINLKSDLPLSSFLERSVVKLLVWSRASFQAVGVPLKKHFPTQTQCMVN